MVVEDGDGGDEVVAGGGEGIGEDRPEGDVAEGRAPAAAGFVEHALGDVAAFAGPAEVAAGDQGEEVAGAAAEVQMPEGGLAEAAGAAHFGQEDFEFLFEEEEGGGAEEAFDADFHAGVVLGGVGIEFGGGRGGGCHGGGGCG